MSTFLKRSVLITGMTISNSALGFLVQLIMARHFGAGEELDLYFYYLSYPTFVASLFSSIFSYSLLPIISRLSNKVELNSIKSSLLWVLAFPIFLIYLFYLFILVFDDIENKFSFYMFVLGVFIGLAQILQALILTLLNASERQILSAFLLIIPYLFMLIGSLFIKTFGLLVIPFSLFIGTLLSFFIGLYKVRNGIEFIFNWRVVYKFFSKGAVVALGMTCFSSYAIIDAYWASSSGEGVLTTMNYSQRLLIAIGNLAVVAPSVLLIPKISTLLVNSPYRLVRDYLFKSMAAFVVMNFILWCLFFLMSDFIIITLFEGGQFTESNAVDLVATVNMMLPGVFCMLISVMLFRILFCLPGRETLGAVIGIGWSVLYFCFSSIYYTEYSIGLALAYSYSWCILVVILTAVVFWSYKEYFKNEKR